ncbi:CCR4-NOT transcription complex subunit 1, putative [Babesia caballi]|uniref:CCR4-NOT transcription complex subunit 1, putative n=1 Tax=Babesia caballi TaxID=5871 RepID=A0AAV4M189_BABCB|nr:CCR4-NOT transcription complex subunit 1, putative [Babesia caballi]
MATPRRDGDPLGMSEHKRRWEWCKAFYGLTTPLLPSCGNCAGMPLRLISGCAGVWSLLTYLVLSCLLDRLIVFHFMGWNEPLVDVVINTGGQRVLSICSALGWIVGVLVLFGETVEAVARWDAAVWVVQQARHLKRSVASSQEAVRQSEPPSGSIFGRALCFLYGKHTITARDEDECVDSPWAGQRIHKPPKTIPALAAVRGAIGNTIVCGFWVYFVWNITTGRNYEWTVSTMHFSFLNFIKPLICAMLFCLGANILSTICSQRYVAREYNVPPRAIPAFPYLHDGRMFISNPGFAVFMDGCYCSYRVPISQDAD